MQWRARRDETSVRRPALHLFQLGACTGVLHRLDAIAQRRQNAVEGREQARFRFPDASEGGGGEGEDGRLRVRAWPTLGQESQTEQSTAAVHTHTDTNSEERETQRRETERRGEKRRTTGQWKRGRASFLSALEKRRQRSDAPVVKEVVEKVEAVERCAGHSADVQGARLHVQRELLSLLVRFTACQRPTHGRLGYGRWVIKQQRVSMCL